MWTYSKNQPSRENERRIRANDTAFNSQFNYSDNYIQTSKYTLLSFVPVNLLEQFQRLANFYFLCLLVLQFIPFISSLTPVTTAVPLIGVLLLTAIKDAYDDFQRHRSDSQVNNRKSHVLLNGKSVEERWHKVQVGDIIRMENDQFIAADLLLLTTSEPNGLCYIETAELDGETNLKCRQCLMETAATFTLKRLCIFAVAIIRPCSFSTQRPAHFFSLYCLENFTKQKVICTIPPSFLKQITHPSSPSTLLNSPALFLFFCRVLIVTSEISQTLKKMEVMPLPVALDFSEDVWNLSLEDAEEQTARDVLAELLAAELRQARARYRLSNGQQQRAPNEILLPAGILQSIARDILNASADEPCGIRGCMVFIDFEETNSRNSNDRKQRIGAVKCHPYTVNTFELYLTLRPHTTWTSKLPLFLQNLAYRSTMVISQDYSLVKRKLFRSSSQ